MILHGPTPKFIFIIELILNKKKVYDNDLQFGPAKFLINNLLSQKNTLDFVQIALIGLEFLKKAIKNGGYFSFKVS